MNILALDVGVRRTGVAFADQVSGVAVSLPTIAHRTPEELGRAVKRLIEERSADTLVIGIPFLPSGETGAQARHVREAAAAWDLSTDITVVEIDERYSTPREPGAEPDAEAACALLQTFLDRQKRL
jgi:putative Holliday junction resolvase